MSYRIINEWTCDFCGYITTNTDPSGDIPTGWSCFLGPRPRKKKEFLNSGRLTKHWCGQCNPQKSWAKNSDMMNKEVK